MKKPNLSFWQIWNLSFGFLGVQIGYSLQNGNTSRILSALGADVHQLGYFWLAAPFAGLLVQPIVGLSSDKTWTKLGRRVPFILGGAIISALAMFFMPNAEFFSYLFMPLIFGAIMLLLMDTSFNITMQPFRALVGDMVNDDQRNLGYSLQSFLINTGAVLGSLLPIILTGIGIANVPAEGEKVAPTVIWSFYLGGGILLATVLWTAFNTKEYPPKVYEQYNNVTSEEKSSTSMGDLLKGIPPSMWRLAIVQFFSWFALFLMWVYTTSGIAENIWGIDPKDTASQAFNDAGNWTGVIFACYSLFAAAFSVMIPRFAKAFGRKKTYRAALIFGGISLLSMVFIHDKYLLIAAMIGVGVSWAAILAMPYAILSASLPASKMGVYMGLFNATITIPQIAAGFLGGAILLALDGKAISMLGVAGVSMIIAGLSVYFVIDKNRKIDI